MTLGQKFQVWDSKLPVLLLSHTVSDRKINSIKKSIGPFSSYSGVLIEILSRNKSSNHRGLNQSITELESDFPPPSN